MGTDKLTEEQWETARAEHRMALVEVSEGSLEAIFNEGLEGYTLVSEVEGLPAGARACGVDYRFEHNCWSMRFVHPDLQPVEQGHRLPSLIGTIKRHPCSLSMVRDQLERLQVKLKMIDLVAQSLKQREIPGALTVIDDLTEATRLTNKLQEQFGKP